ncbi:MAG: hypothetical protein KIT84_20445 [Labilithrix sp.]|nr:hypothetical protein [Labilithrix sp.]MCW5813410.1 hypothetical protein [Labilithrix sp.]
MSGGPAAPRAPQHREAEAARIEVRHLRAGWWGLALFVVGGLGLEVLHAVKAPFYLDAGQETTRLLLRLAHAHGTGLSLLQIAFALTARAWPATATRLASVAFLAAYVLLPGGFFLGALGASRGDPGLGVVLVPAGAVALLVAVGSVSRRIRDPSAEEAE